MHLISPYSHDTAAPYTLQGAATFGGKIKQGDVERQVTFLDSPSLEISSICLTPLTRASMTRVDVTSFSLKKRFTTPCVWTLTVSIMSAIASQNHSVPAPECNPGDATAQTAMLETLASKLEEADKRQLLSACMSTYHS